MNYPKPAVRTHAWCENPGVGDNIDDPGDSYVNIGWPVSDTPPARQYWNFLINWMWVAIRYFMQRGLVDYDAAELYQINARIIGDDGNTYSSLQNTNTGHTPSTSPTWWQLWGFSLSQLIATINGLLNNWVTVAPATPVFNAALGNNFYMLIDRNVTAPTVINVTPGQRIRIAIVQNGTGGWAFMWPANVYGGGAVLGNINSVNQQDFTIMPDNTVHASGGIVVS